MGLLNNDSSNGHFGIILQEIQNTELFIKQRKTIPRFSGSPNEALIEDWLQECEKAAKLNGWNENEKLSKFSKKLKGAALDYHQELFEIENYEEWKNKMIMKFKLEDKEFYQKRLQELKQTPEQSVTSFFLELNSLFVKAYGLAILTEKSLNEIRLRRKVTILSKGLRPDVWSKIQHFAVPKRGKMPSWTRIFKEAIETEREIIMLEKLKSKTRQFKNEENFTEVYIACSAIKRQEVGYGVFFDKNSSKNVSKKVKNEYPTCNVALILAAIMAIEQAKKDGICQLKIYTNATYLLNFTTWVINWIENGWTKRNGSPILNVEYWRRLLVALEKIDVTWSSTQTMKNKWAFQQARQLAQFGRRGQEVY